MSNHWFEKLVGPAKNHPETTAQGPTGHPVSPVMDAYVLDVWLERAASLKQLRMYDRAYRVMNMARGITLESMQADPSDPMAWVNIGRVQIADEKFDSAKEVLSHAIELAKKCGNTEVEGFAGAALFQLLRQQSSASHETLDLTKSLTQEQYQIYLRQNLEKMFYVCQSCGHLNLMLGEHCAHCRFAPQNLGDVQLSVTLSTINFKTPTMLAIALQIQQGHNPREFIPELADAISRADSDQDILEKIKQHTEDDYLDFKTLDHCPSCAKVVWASNADVCPNCHVELNRSTLLKLAICVDRLLQQLIWSVRGSETAEFAEFVILLVNLEYSLVRGQMAPTDAQRHTATELLLKISPLYTQNGGGVVWIKSSDSVVGEVIDANVHKDIGPTISFLRDELRHFLQLVSDAVSLF